MKINSKIIFFVGFGVYFLFLFTPYKTLAQATTQSYGCPVQGVWDCDSNTPTCSGVTCSGPCTLINSSQCDTTAYATPPTVTNNLVVNSPCNVNNTCGQGLICDPTSNVCKLPLGASCSSSNNNCQTGATCDSSTNTCLLSGTPPTITPTIPTTGTIPTSSGCPSGLTANANGLCLPPNQFTTGVAASTSLIGLMLSIIQFLLFFAGIVAVVIVILGGYWYMTAAGNEEQSEKGKKTIINFVLGLIIIVMGYTIVNILFNTLTSTTLH